MSYVSESSHPGPSVLIPRKGRLKNLFYVDSPFWTVDTIFYTEIDTNLANPKFIYYYLTTMELEKLNVSGGVPSLTQTMLNQLQLPIPSLALQGEIVQKLDSFLAHLEDIEIGLPAEITGRRNQYEFYRDKLLTFEELEVA